MEAAARRSIFSRFLHGFWRTAHIHCALMACSLPLMLAWGMPLPLLGIFGNIIFAPFLLIFLFLASCMVIAQLFHLPLGPLAWLIEQVVNFWCFTTSYVSPCFMFEVAQPSYCILSILGIAICMFFHYKTAVPMPVRCAYILLFIAVSCFFVRLWCTPAYAQAKPQKNIPLILVRFNNKIVGIDQGVNGRSGVKKLGNRFFAALRQQLGSTALDLLILLKPTASSYDLARQLLATSHSCTIIMPTLYRASPAVSVAISNLQEWARKQGHMLIILPSDRSFKLAGPIEMCIESRGFLPRTTKFMHPFLAAVSTNPLLPLEITPVITRRERALLQRQLTPRVNR